MDLSAQQKKSEHFLMVCGGPRLSSGVAKDIGVDRSTMSDTFWEVAQSIAMGSEN